MQNKADSEAWLAKRGSGWYPVTFVFVAESEC
jgi:hypothetical protein